MHNRKCSLYSNVTKLIRIAVEVDSVVEVGIYSYLSMPLLKIVCVALALGLQDRFGRNQLCPRVSHKFEKCPDVSRVPRVSHRLKKYPGDTKVSQVATLPGALRQKGDRPVEKFQQRNSFVPISRNPAHA